MSEDTSKLSSNDFDDLMRAINTDIRNDAIRWACQVLVDHERTLILNTKAIGEEGKVELAEVSIITIKGEVLLSTPVKPI